MACACTSPPGVPKGMARPSGPRASAGLGVSRGRLPGATALASAPTNPKKFFTPGWTDYKKRVHYHTYDVTDRVKKGDNVLGAILGDGWYAGYFSYQGKREIYGKNPRLRVQLDLVYDDGSRKSIITDDSWKAAYGPEREADLLMGSAYDARLANSIAGWSTAGKSFDD